MATVEFRYDPKNTAWFTANAAMVLKAGEPAYHDTTGLFKLGDGVTALSALSFLPTVSASTPTIQQVLTAGQVATTTIETTGFIKTGGLSTQFLKADGSVDSNVYGVGDALTTNPLSQFAATTSSQLASVISDETGSGALVFGTSPTFTTNITTPLIVGGSGIASKITYTGSTNATPTLTGIAHSFYVGNNGADEAIRILHNGRVGLHTNPTYDFCVNGSDTANDGILISSATYVNVPNPGTVSNTTLITGRGFNMATDSTVLTGSYIPTLGIGLASNRSGALLGLKNTSASGYSILIEDGNMGVFTSNPYTELQVAGNITTTWANSNIGTWYQDGTQYRMGFNTVIANRQLNLHAYTADTGGYITFSTGTAGSPFVNLRINPAQTSGSLVNYDFTNPTSTNLTATTNIPNFRISGANKQWATGTVAKQYFNYFSANTVSFVGASTATLAANFVADYVQGGTNATITTNTAIHVPTLALTNTTYGTGMYIVAPTGATTNTAAKFLQNNGQVDIGSIAAGYSTIWMGQATPSGSNYTVLMTGSTACVLHASATVGLSQNQGTHSLILGAGTLTLSDTTLNLVFGSTNGTKLGTATTQKLSFWNATPIVQPTTAVAAATVVSGTGGNVKHDDTFDGYTLEKIVKALRNIGLLA